MQSTFPLHGYCLVNISIGTISLLKRKEMQKVDTAFSITKFITKDKHYSHLPKILFANIIEKVLKMFILQIHLYLFVMVMNHLTNCFLLLCFLASHNLQSTKSQKKRE